MISGVLATVGCSLQAFCGFASMYSELYDEQANQYKAPMVIYSPGGTILPIFSVQVQQTLVMILRFSPPAIPFFSRSLLSPHAEASEGQFELGLHEVLESPSMSKKSTGISLA